MESNSTENAGNTDPTQNKTPQDTGSGWTCDILPKTRPSPTAVDASDLSTKPLKVIGAGWGRTGTMSLKTALDILGMPCYHMVECMKQGDQEFWLRVSEKQDVDFSSVYAARGYTATVDYPSAPYYKELMAAYPDAKVILTLRDPEKWYKSCCETIFNFSQDSGRTPIGIRVMMNFIFGGTTGKKMISRVVGHESFHDDWSKENIIRCYNAHIEEVRRTVPPEKLLEIDVTEGKGWGPLCEFLGLPIPEEPFPKVNETAEMQRRIRTVNAMGWVAGIAMLGIPLLMEAWNAPPLRAED